MLPVLLATRYVLALREGGSLPAVLDTRDGGLYVAKFRGAGQGARALAAEIVVGSLARRLELPMPEMALIELDAAFGRSERDPEIQDILRGSVGINVGHRYLEGALNFDPLADAVAADFAARTVWLDALVSNVDRTARNPNLLWWSHRPWLIDHGAALYFHHNWGNLTPDKARLPFAPIADHVLLGAAADLRELDAPLAEALSEEAIAAAVDCVPDEILMDSPPGVSPPFPTAEENRAAYREYFRHRLRAPRLFARHAAESQRRVRADPATGRRSYRR